MAEQAAGSALPISGLPPRGRVTCVGFIESVTYQPASDQAYFSAIVTDTEAERQRGVPEARLRVIWLGRRRVPGIEAGVEVRLEGMVTERDGLPTMFNPRYDILSRKEYQ
ncbi:hypothetical protein [Arthrobacter sp. M4]|uniref:hypothetical protein n=1 Tax=Arthrobacter sp. M4 TaxID=218160 RepID=UPI001CDC2474|nr:hypothetical protein [Arthrobacter sp. M4]MCA4132715.1 hypothetical protein [Arthrobacter sp. M4]